MPSIRRRAFLSIAAVSGVAGCTDLLRRSSTDEDTSPANRRVSASFGPESGEWIRSTRSFDNDIVSPTARPPQDEPNERWSARDRGSVSDIAVADGVVFAGGHRGIEARRLEDGDRRWDDDDENVVFVAAIDGRCYVANREALVARDAETGDVVWRHELADNSRLRSFLEVDGTVYYTADGALHGVHADTGDRRWTVDGEAREGTLALADGTLHWTTVQTHRLFEPKGASRPAERSAIPLDGYDSRIRPSEPAVVDGTIALGGFDEDFRHGAPVRCLSSRGTIWSRPFEPYVPTPATVGNRLLATGYDNRSGGLDESTVASFDLETGDLHWETTVPEPAGPPAVADGVIYTGGGHPGESASEAGSLFALEVETGDVRWELETDGARAGHALALVDDVIVLGTRGGVVVLE
ncbi:PQQ-binding-like beta-propeller repeat protein [Natronorubrum sp. JWXQ-INN-674]|uniref:PQQ-binding-like beta-propeller repeat protein n=1 Tax=Natronorubrum halalkaliphilum TaxID=2691917 RepID=A0A6B0VJA6_9EURY|nr:PQQ-binding-like beta-propeller repeat protein [Natronorubrum halalkaliphilum]MXV61207.1 PQQ-binding-like beta-propeller repeat protein [Natronorubrum halalkaliphilum]